MIKYNNTDDGRRNQQINVFDECYRNLISNRLPPNDLLFENLEEEAILKKGVNLDDAVGFEPLQSSDEQPLDENNDKGEDRWGISSIVQHHHLRHLSQPIKVLLKFMFVKDIFRRQSVNEIKQYLVENANIWSGKLALMQRCIHLSLPILVRHERHSNHCQDPLELALVAAYSELNNNYPIATLSHESLKAILQNEWKGKITAAAKYCFMSMIVKHAISFSGALCMMQKDVYEEYEDLFLKYYNSTAYIADVSSCRMIIEFIYSYLGINCDCDMKMNTLITAAILTGETCRYNNGKNKSHFEEVIEEIFHRITSCPRETRSSS